MSKIESMIPAIRTVTSNLPRIRGLGLLLAFIANYFRKRTRIDIEVSVFGRKMLLNTGDWIGNALIFTPQWYDHKERKFLRGILEKGDYVVDIGANIGAYTLIFADLVGESGLITSIEAEEQNARRLTHNVSINGIDWIRIHNNGVSDKQETLSMLLNVTGNAGMHSFFREPDKDNSPVRRIECMPLGNLIENRKAKLFKLDIEGFEWRVLRKYFEDVSESLWPTYILLEDDPKNREDDAVSLCQDHGYSILNRYDCNAIMMR